MKTIEKDPNATLDYSVDWSQWLGDDKITSSTWIIPTGIKKTIDSHDDVSATVWLSGGRMGEEHVITNRIVTQAGRKDDRSFVLSIVRR